MPPATGPPTALRTGLAVCPRGGMVERHGGCWVVSTPANPSWICDNFLQFDAAPPVADTCRWPALFGRSRGPLAPLAVQRHGVVANEHDLARHVDAARCFNVQARWRGSRRVDAPVGAGWKAARLAVRETVPNPLRQRCCGWLSIDRRRPAGATPRSG